MRCENFLISAHTRTGNGMPEKMKDGDLEAKKRTDASEYAPGSARGEKNIRIPMKIWKI